jgi:hypothetical protein
MTPFLPAISVRMRTRYRDIYVVITVAALGYLWLTAGLHQKVTSLSGYMIEHKGEIVPGGGRHKGAPVPPMTVAKAPEFGMV